MEINYQDYLQCVQCDTVVYTGIIKEVEGCEVCPACGKLNSFKYVGVLNGKEDNNE